MRNRAKCKLCQSIIESFSIGDLVSCKCGEISISGGNIKYECLANDFSNFLRVDDEANEIIVQVKSKDLPHLSEHFSKPSRKDLLESLDHMIQNLDRLPEHAKILPINHYDLGSFMMLISSLFRSLE